MAWELREMAISTIEAHLAATVRWPDKAVLATVDLLDHTPHWQPYIAVWNTSDAWYAAWRRGRYRPPFSERNATWRRVINLGRVLDLLWDEGYFRDRDLIAQIEAELADIAVLPLDDGTTIDRDGEA